MMDTYKEQYGNHLREFRLERKMTQIEFGELIGISASLYNHIENAKFVHFNKRVRDYADSIYLLKEEKKKLQEILDVVDAEKKGERDKYRIKNIPGFYDDLNALGDIQLLDKNDPRLQALRKKLGVPMIMTSKVSADYGFGRGASVEAGASGRVKAPDKGTECTPVEGGAPVWKNVDIIKENG